jgi:hypothetical protein
MRVCNPERVLPLSLIYGYVVRRLLGTCNAGRCYRKHWWTGEPANDLSPRCWAGGYDFLPKSALPVKCFARFFLLIFGFAVAPNLIQTAECVLILG